MKAPLRRAALVALLPAAIVVASARAAAAARIAPCPSARFAVSVADAVRLGLPAGAGRLLDFGGRTITLPGCTAARAVVRTTRAATTVRARWKRCGARTGVRLTARIARDTCSVLEGSLAAKRRRAARFRALRSTCGDGVTDAAGGETCDAGGCQAGAECRMCACMPAVAATTTTSTVAASSTTSSSTTTSTTLPPTNQGLIAQALAAGRIDQGTSLVYRAWALFWDPRLPAEFDGEGSTGEDNRLFLEARDAWSTLSPDVQDQLAPYVLYEPTDPRSAFGPVNGEGPLPQSTQPQVDTHCRTRWSERVSAQGHFKAFLCVSNDPAVDETAFTRVLSVAEGLWPAMTKAPPDGLGKPFNFGNPVPIHILDTNQCRPRGLDAECKTISGTAVAAALTTEPVNGNRSNGYLLISRNRLADTTKLTSDMAHEFFHVLQYAHNVKVIEGSWFTEASATWAETFYARASSASEVHWRFSNLFQVIPMSLLSLAIDHDYASYIWPFFVQQEKGGAAAAIFQAWIDAESAADAKGLTDAVDKQLPFKEHFRDFAVRNVNANLQGNPLGTRYMQLDGGFPDGVRPLELRRNEDGSDRAKQLRAGSTETANPTLAPLTAVYAEFSLPEENTRHLKLDASQLLPAERRDIDVLVRATVNQDWKRIRLSEDTLTLCRDRADEDVDRLILVLGNHDKDPAGELKGTVKVEAKATCGYPRRLGLDFSITDTVNDSSVGASSEAAYSGNATFVFDHEQSDVAFGQFSYRLERLSGSVRFSGSYPAGQSGTCTGTGSGGFSSDNAPLALGGIEIARDPGDKTLARFAVAISGVFASPIPVTWLCPDADPRTEGGPASVTLTSDLREFQWGSWPITDAYTVEMSLPPSSRSVQLTLNASEFAAPE